MPSPAFFQKEDAILLVVLSLAGGWVLYRASETLQKFRDATRITKQEKLQDIIGQHTEDAISVDTLGELYNSSNWEIRQASVRILVERAVRHPNVELLLHNAASKKEQIREEAMTILSYLIVNERGSLNNPKIYRIIVDALVAYLPESAEREHEPHTDWKLRSKTEDRALNILRFIMVRLPNGAVNKWLDAGLITRWLGQYPIGGKKVQDLNPRAALKMRAELIDDIRTGQTDDVYLEFILGELVISAAARIQLRKYKLLGSYSKREEVWSCNSSVAYYSDISYTDSASARRHNGNNDADRSSETARRRRRREAVVIGDAGQPLSQDNIFNVDTELLEHGEVETSSSFTVGIIPRD